MLGEEASPPPDAGASALVDFGTLPFGAIAAVVSQLGPLPSHQAGAALGALRLLSRHWRAAMDDAVAAWHAPPAATADAIARLLHRWRHLRRLTLQHCEVSAAVVDALAHCRRLQELHLCVVALPPASSSLFDMLATLPALRLLHLNPAEGLPPGASLKALAACTALRSLALESLYQQDVAADVAEIVRGTGARLDHLALFRSLRALGERRGQAAAGGSALLRSVDGMTQWLHLLDARPRPAAPPHACAAAVQAQQPCDLGVASRLTSLELRCTYTTDDAFLQLFDSLARLQSLDISCEWSCGATIEARQ